MPTSIVHGPQRCERPQNPAVNMAQQTPSKISKI